MCSYMDFDRKHRFYQGIAYTEDFVAIYNLHVNYIPKELSKQFINSYFQQYGKVQYFEFFQNEPDFNSALIYYGNGSEAANALSSTFDGKIFHSMFVKGCHSWTQPNAEFGRRSIKDALCANRASNNSGTEMPIINLDCLALVCDYLSLPDKLNFAFTCEQFREAFLLLPKSRYHRFSFLDYRGLTTWQIKELLNLIGSHIQRLEYYGPKQIDPKLLILFLCTYVKNVTVLKLESTPLTSKRLEFLFDHLKGITELRLDVCYVTDDYILKLLSLAHLEKLSLTGNINITGKHLHRLVKITSLILKSCLDLENGHLDDILRDLKELQLLDITYCHKINVPSQLEKVRHFQKLECLGIEVKNKSVVEKLNQLCYVNHLLIAASDDDLREVLRTVMGHKANTLRALQFTLSPRIQQNEINHTKMARRFGEKNVFSIYTDISLADMHLNDLNVLTNLEFVSFYRCFRISDDGLLAFMKGCPKLNRIDVRYCGRISNQFILDVIDFRTKQSYLLYPEHTTIFVLGTSLTLALELSPAYRKAKTWLHLVFKQKVPTHL